MLFYHGYFGIEYLGFAKKNSIQNVKILVNITGSDSFSIFGQLFNKSF